MINQINRSASYARVTVQGVEFHAIANPLASSHPVTPDNDHTYPYDKIVSRNLEMTGDKYVLVHNPLAKNPLKERFIKYGRECIPEQYSDTEYRLRWN